MEGLAREKRRLLEYETSRRTFLRGAAAAGVGAAVAALWDPRHVAKVGAGRASAATVAGAAKSRSRDTVWSPEATDGSADSASDQRFWVAHLLRRAGFGATAADLDQYAPLGTAGAVDALLNYQSVSDPAMDIVNSAGLDLTKVTDAQRAWLLRMIYTTRPLQEKMTLFWHGILTSGISKVGGRYLNTMIAQNEFLRANAIGSSDVLLKGISRDPAMMYWLDLQTSSKQHPNENFARELMELFSLGIGHYTEIDVRESARAFTGYQLNKDRQFVFNKNNHDDTSKTFLSQAGNFGGDDVIEIILQQRAAAEYVATRLWRYFAYDNPEPEVVSALADTFQSSNHSIAAVLRQLFNMQQFYSATALQAVIKSPAEFVVGAARALNLQTDAAGYPLAMAQMNQVLYDPPNVAGWPGGATWLSSASFFARMNFINGLIYAKNGPDARALFGEYAALGVDDAVSLATDRLLSMAVSGASADVIQQYLVGSNGGTAGVTDKNVKGFIYLVLATPENQLN